MDKMDSVVATFPDHVAAEAAVKKLQAAGFDMKNLSVIGKGFHTEEKVVGFYNMGDRVKFWGARGAFWGGFWGLFFGGLVLTVPVVGHVVVLGYLSQRPTQSSMLLRNSKQLVPNFWKPVGFWIARWIVLPRRSVSFWQPSQRQKLGLRLC